jgi:ADP-ribosylglycohydrolase
VPTQTPMEAFRSFAASLNAGDPEREAAINAIKAGAPTDAVALVMGVSSSTVRRWAAS